MTVAELEPFDPEWLKAEEMMGGRFTTRPEPIQESRNRIQAVFDSLAPLIPPPTSAVRTEDVQIHPKQRVRIYIPTAVQTTSAKLPVALYIHTGGWFAGSIEAEDFLCRDIAEQTNTILYSPDYSLAPECPFPAGLNDCVRAYEYMHTTALQYNGDTKKKFVMGSSVGGNLAASVSLHFAADEEKQPAGLLVACMLSCDPKVLPEEYKARYTPEKYADSPFIGHEIIQQGRDWYGAHDLADPLYSPLLHPNIRLLPQVHISAPTKDPTHQETCFFYEECLKQGVKADLVEWKGWPNFFWILPNLPKSAEFMNAWCERLNKMIEAV